LQRVRILRKYRILNLPEMDIKQNSPRIKIIIPNE
jgi:hypothetical protein